MSPFFALSEVYVTLRVGDGSVWAQSTDFAKNAGLEDTEWKYDPNDMCGKVKAAHLHRNVINLTVKDSTETSVDKYVGKAKLNMEEILDESNTNKLVTLSGELHGHDESEVTGEYIVKLKYHIPNAKGSAVTEEVVSDMLDEEENGEENTSNEEN